MRSSLESARAVIEVARLDAPADLWRRLTLARRMIARAREIGLKVMVGCMTEGSVGVSAIAQLLPQVDYVDMDGAVLIAEGGDIAHGVRLDRSRTIFRELNGCGFTLINHARREAATGLQP